MNKLTIGRTLGAITLVSALATAQLRQIPPQLNQKLNELVQAKAQQTSAQKKLSSALVSAVKASRGEWLTPSIQRLQSHVDRVGTDQPTGRALVSVKTASIGAISTAIAAAGGAVIGSSRDQITARVPLVALEGLAARADVLSIMTPGRAQRFNPEGPLAIMDKIKALESRPELRFRAASLREALPGLIRRAEAMQAGYVAPFQIASLSLPRLMKIAPVVNSGLSASQGIVSHRAREVNNNLGVTGAGITIGVLSDSAEFIPNLKATGDLPAGAMILPGRDIISGPGSSEGTALMEIVYDMAPGANVLFATAFNSPESFGDNIRALAQAGCQVIVDDVGWSTEGVFQNGPIAKAVDDVSAAGVVYFSSAGNGGSALRGNSGTWVGDYNFSGGIFLGQWEIHNYGGGIIGNGTSGGYTFLQWSDPLGGSANDYDLIAVDNSFNILDASTNFQTGTQDPFEDMVPPAGSFLLLLKFSGAPRALYLSGFGPVLGVQTPGSTFGHPASPNGIGVAAVHWNSERRGTRPFVGGAANPTEVFSSDGPARRFYNPDGTAITPNNFLFGTNGGLALSKPDIAAADAVTCRTPGFNPFFGTSAAAPHAAGIAALIKAKKPSLTRAQIIAIMKGTALDNMSPGVDIQSGSGIAMAYQAVVSAN